MEIEFQIFLSPLAVLWFAPGAGCMKVYLSRWVCLDVDPLQFPPVEGEVVVVGGAGAPAGGSP